MRISASGNPEKAKKKAIAKAHAERNKARSDYYEDKGNYPARKAVIHMTTPKGYSSDPLVPRGGSKPEKPRGMRPKFVS